MDCASIAASSFTVRVNEPSRRRLPQASQNVRVTFRLNDAEALQMRTFCEREDMSLSEAIRDSLYDCGVLELTEVRSITSSSQICGASSGSSVHPTASMTARSIWAGW